MLVVNATGSFRRTYEKDYIHCFWINVYSFGLGLSREYFSPNHKEAGSKKGNNAQTDGNFTDPL